MAVSTGAAILGGSIIGGGLSAYGANKAAKAQRAAADKASATELEMFYAAQEAQKPWLDVGGNSLNELAYRLGIEGSGSGGASGGKFTPLGLDDLIDNSSDVWKPNADLYADSSEYRDAWDKWSAWHRGKYGVDAANSRGSHLDTGRNQLLGYGFNLDAYNAAQREKSLVDAEARKNDPKYGSLLTNFTEEDFWADPVTKLGFQFGLDEGTKGLNRQLSASGGINSGAALKALTRFGNDYASTKGNEAFNRFNVNQDKTFNRLARLAGVGQSASAQTANNAMQTGQALGDNIIGAGNARAASYIAGTNALTSGIGQGVNMWQQQQYINKLPQPSKTYMTPSGGIDYTKNGWWDVNSFGAP